MNIQTPVNEVRNLRFDEFSSLESPAKATEQARKRNYQDFLIVDVDLASLRERILQRDLQVHREPGASPAGDRNPPRAAAAPACSAARSAIRTSAGASRATGCASTRRSRTPASTATSRRRCAGWTPWASTMPCLFPTPMLFLGTHPQVEVEVAMARAYNRWLVRARSWPKEQRIVSMLYLPFNDPEATLQDGQGFRRQAGRRRLHGHVAALQAGARQRLHEDLSRCWRRWASRSRSMRPTTGTTSRCS